MITPSWYSQPFRPDGGISAEGLLNQLGRPALSVLTVLVRESAQNSWDARTDDVVDYRIDLGSVNAANSPVWRDLLGRGQPGPGQSEFPLRAALRRTVIPYLSISDRGTRGLGGPTRSDAATAVGEARNWLSFVLNSGDKQDSDGGGGTYGFGKGAFFLASKVGTILIYSRFVDASGTLTSRLIASSMASSYTALGVPFTGRHWWGFAADGYCEPLSGDDADDIARSLGIPGFRGRKTGTTIVVIDPDLTDPSVPEEDASEMSIDSAARYLADAVAWNLWPLTAKHRISRMDVAVTGNGLPVRVPSEDNDAGIKHFVDAYKVATSSDADLATCGRPKALLGRLGSSVSFGVAIDSPAAREHGLEGSPHHFALMRQPDLVVRYVSGPAKQNPDVGYAGVFKVDDGLDSTFARAEPPTHDAWVDSQLKGSDATFVRVAARRVREKSDDLAGAKFTSTRAQSVAVGSLSRRLGHLMSGPGGLGATEGQLGDGVAQPDEKQGPDVVDGQGGDGFGDSAGKRSAKPNDNDRPLRSKRVVLKGEPAWDMFEGQDIVRQTVVLPAAGRYRGVCRVVTGDGGHEGEGPIGSAVPLVLGWRSTERLSLGDYFESPGPGEIDLLVAPVADVVFDMIVESAP